MRTTFQEYVTLAEHDCKAGHPTLRRGQVYYNRLRTHRPDLAKLVVGGHLDPYYMTGSIQSFLDFIEAEWDKDYNKAMGT